MTNIVVIGCSWSRAYDNTGAKYFMSWPEHLAAKHSDLFVYNYSQYCNSVPGQLLTQQLLFDIFKNTNISIDAMILQFTRHGRKTYIKSIEDYKKTLLPSKLTLKETKNYMEYPEELCYYDEKTPEDSLVVHLNSANVNINSPSKIIQSYTTEMLYGIDSTSLNVSLIEQHMVKQCHKRNIPVVAYKHLHTDYTSHLDFVLQDCVDFDNYTIDDGYHFGQPGSAMLADIIYEKLNV